MHLHQAKDVLPGLPHLQGQFLHFVFVHAQELSAGFKLGRATEPVAGVFDFLRVHGNALRILFVHTVIEV